MPALLAGIALEDIVVGLTILLLLWATESLWGPALIALAERVPFVGGQIAGVIGSVEDRIRQLGQQAAQFAMWPIVAFWRATGGLLNEWTAQAEKTTRAGAENAWELRHVALPAAEARAEKYAGTLFAVLQSWTLNLYQGLLSYTQTRLGQLQAYAEQLYRAGLAFSQRLALQAQEYARQLSGSDQAYTRAVGAQAIGYAGQVGQQAEGYARQLDSLERAFSQGGIDALFRDLLQERSDQLRYTDASVSQAEQYARALSGQAIGYAQSLALPLAAAITAVEESPCMRACDVLGDLGGALGAIDGLAILGLIGFCATHPAEAQRFLHDEVAPIVNGAEQAAAALVGLRGQS